MSEERAAKFELEIDDVDPAALRFLAFRGEERLFECYRMQVEVLCRRIDPAALLGRKATLYVRFEGDAERMFHGLVWSAELAPLEGGAFRLRVEIAPRFLSLSLGRSSRIFPGKSIVAVVHQVLKDAGLPQSAYEMHASEGPTHDAIVQHEESDYDFIRRLLFEEGIGFLIQNDPDQERVIFFDDAKQLIAVDGSDVLVDRRRKDTRRDTVFDLREEVCATPDGVMLREYDPFAPSQSPDADKSLGETSSRQVYQHPGGHFELDQRAQRMLERLALPARRLVGRSYWPHLEPGRHARIESDVRPSLASEVVFVRVEHTGHLRDTTTAAAYLNSFSVIPKSTPFRPDSVPKTPMRAGAQRAFVTGPAGQELHGDSLGRVTVRFPWDRSGITDDKSSGFLRVGQPPLSGSMIVPRVGFEVLIGHELGDFDRPYVTGHLYNDDDTTPYGNDRQTTSSFQSATTEGGAGANELRFVDSAGSEEMMINASYDMQVRAENTLTWNVGNDETIEVGSDALLSVKGDAFTSVGGNRTLDVGAMQTQSVGGNSSEGVGGDHTVTIGAARTVTVSGDQVEHVSGTLSRTISAAQNVIVVDGFTREIGGSSQVKVGAAWAETVTSSKSTTVAGARAEQVGGIKMISADAVDISADTAYGESVDSQKLEVGADKSDASDDTLKLSAKDGMSIEAANVSISADDELVFSAGDVTITLKKAGELAVKAKKITIKNAKALKQITHKSN